MASLKEKIGYGLGDMSSSMFWKIFTAYLPIFYSNIFHLSLEATGVLMLVTRIWDAVSDPMMGIIADRTETRWGKYRPWLLWMALPFAVAGILLFTTPDLGNTGKTVWAFATYILMMTVYTGINVPYGSMLGVMTESSKEKTVFSSFRMFFAYGGSFIVLFCWEPLCGYFRDKCAVAETTAWQWSMIVVATCCLILFLLTFALTREHVKPMPKKTNVASDLLTVLKNKPWWILLGAVLFFQFFGAIRYATIPYFFQSLIGSDATINVYWLSYGAEGGLTFGWVPVLFFSGLFLSVGEVSNMAGVACATPVTLRIGKKNTFIACLVLLMVSCISFYYVPVTATGFWVMIGLQIFICIMTGIISPLVWSMYADIADYAEVRFHTSSTGLIFSSSSMAQKFGGAIGGAAVLWILAAVGYNTEADAVQTAGAVQGLQVLMSWLPAAVAGISLLFILIYPLGTKKMEEVSRKLKTEREGQKAEA